MRRKSLKNLPLLFARLAILIFVVFALARPVGNFFNFSNKSPDSVFILLDRSPEMSGSSSSGKTHLQVALAEVQSALQDFQGSTRVYLIDSASLELTPVLSSEYLPLLSQAQSGDNPSSIPQLVSKKTLVQQEAQIRPFVYETQQEEDLSLTITKTAKEGEQVILELQILGGVSEQPVAIEGSWSDGTLIQEEVVIQESQTSYEISLLTGTKSGAGTLTLPADQNIANNEAYFSFGPLLDVRTVIITDVQESQLTKYLKRAVALSSRPHQKTRWISPVKRITVIGSLAMSWKPHWRSFSQ